MPLCCRWSAARALAPALSCLLLILSSSDMTGDDEDDDDEEEEGKEEESKDLLSAATLPREATAGCGGVLT